MELLEFYIDFDGLGTNWQDYVLKTHFPEFKNIEELNQHPHRTELIRSMYEREPNLFRNLPPLMKYQQLLSLLTELNVRWNILTAVGSDHPCYQTAREDKLHYIQHHFGVESNKVIVSQTSEDKYLYARKGAVLVDDFRRNCREWEEAGGTAIFVEANVYSIDDLIKRVTNLIHNA